MGRKLRNIYDLNAVINSFRDSNNHDLTRDQQHKKKASTERFRSWLRKCADAASKWRKIDLIWKKYRSRYRSIPISLSIYLYRQITNINIDRDIFRDLYAPDATTD